MARLSVQRYPSPPLAPPRLRSLQVSALEACGPLNPSRPPSRRREGHSLRCAARRLSRLEAGGWKPAAGSRRLEAGQKSIAMDSDRRARPGSVWPSTDLGTGGAHGAITVIKNRTLFYPLNVNPRSVLKQQNLHISSRPSRSRHGPPRRWAPESEPTS